MMPLDPTLESRVRDVIARVALVPCDSLDLDADLTGAGVDSLSLLRVVAEVEAEFDAMIPDEGFATIRTLRGLMEAVSASSRACRWIPR